jgi:hypothetical protein
MCDENILKRHAASQDVVRIKCRDGLVFAARILHVDDEYRDVIFRRAPVAGDSTVAQHSPVGLLLLSDISGIEESAEPCGLAS